MDVLVAEDTVEELVLQTLQGKAKSQESLLQSLTRWSRGRKRRR